ncbi:hypothetical protein MPSEU_000884200 [Mayamaea pseudoterrestris]|nr:hypothetical protein MPSEU_000884200 [Mayamaea pseudoterrestris]
MTSARLSYTPQPHEQAYYEGLFQAADVQRGGAIGGPDAVRFFSSSKLSIDALKSIWTVADQPPTNSLDRYKFAVAVRLIQLLQNGQRGQGEFLAAPPGVTLRPVFFEGFSGVSVPMPTPAGPLMQQSHQQQQPQQSVQSISDHASVHSQQQQMQRSLTVQDPYTMTPQEQSRYEALFPQYAKPDGFCYGAEAVALFTKSGVPQDQLAALWNMVDSPVDNRLDKLEFAMAMHLIVCVSKKNLPMPPALPTSLKLLKGQQGQGQGQGQPAPLLQPQQTQQPPQSPMTNMSTTATTNMQPPPLQANVSNMTGVSIGGGNSSHISSPQSMRKSLGAPGLNNLPGPPPLQPQGGMSISDAFEGLDAAGGASGGGGGGGASVTSFGGGGLDEHSYHQFSQPPVAGSSSFDMGPSASVARVSSPVVKTDSRRPKTSEQLKHSYNLESSSEELTKLKEILQKLQAENISLKASMGHLNEEEKDIQRELGAVVSEISKLSNELTTLRAKVLASKSKLIEAAAELSAAKEKKSVIQDLIGEAKSTKVAIDEAYDGIERATAALQAPAMTTAPSFDHDLFGIGSGGDVTLGSAPVPAAAQRESFTSPVVDTVGSFASQESQPRQVEQQYSYQSHYSEQLAPESTSVYQQQYTMPLNNFGHQGVADNGNYGKGGPTHRKNQSTGSFGNIMGGDVGALPSENTTLSLYAVPETNAAESSPSMDDVGALKKKLKEAEDVAREAEDSRRAVAAELDEIRRVADEADQKARQFQVDLDKQATKKKGLLGGRGKKKEAKEGEQLSADSNQKKTKVLQIQAQLKDAEALASDTRKEVERLRREVEDSEVQVASAASMQHQQSLSAPSYGAPLNDYGGASPTTMSAAPSWFPQTNQSAPVTNGDGSMGGFESHVMGGGGGYDIPEPVTGDADPYGNPFE